MTQKEFYQNLEGWEDMTDPKKLYEALRNSNVTTDLEKTITVEECNAYLNEKYPVIDGIDKWLRKYRSKKRSK